MPSVIVESEIGVPEAERAGLTDEQLVRSVDLIIVRLRDRRYTFREIAFILGRPAKTIESRYRRIPEEVRDHYASLSLG